jgi:hypothetical protein
VRAGEHEHGRRPRAARRASRVAASNPSLSANNEKGTLGVPFSLFEESGCDESPYDENDEFNHRCSGSLVDPTRLDTVRTRDRARSLRARAGRVCGVPRRAQPALLASRAPGE